jgi:hypothetical protein
MDTCSLLTGGFGGITLALLLIAAGSAAQATMALAREMA